MFLIKNKEVLIQTPQQKKINKCILQTNYGSTKEKYGFVRAEIPLRYVSVKIQKTWKFVS